MGGGWTNRCPVMAGGREGLGGGGIFMRGNKSNFLPQGALRSLYPLIHHDICYMLQFQHLPLFLPREEIPRYTVEDVWLEMGTTDRPPSVRDKWGQLHNLNIKNATFFQVSSLTSDCLTKPFHSSMKRWHRKKTAHTVFMYFSILNRL